MFSHIKSKIYSIVSSHLISLNRNLHKSNSPKSLTYSYTVARKKGNLMPYRWMPWNGCLNNRRWAVIFQTKFSPAIKHILHSVGMFLNKIVVFGILRILK